MKKISNRTCVINASTENGFLVLVKIFEIDPDAAKGNKENYVS